MSAAPLLQPRPVVPRRSRPETPASPVVRRRVAARSRVNPWASFVVATACFLVVAGSTYVLSTLLGHSLVEVARRETVDAQRRTAHAREDLVRLRERVDRLTSMKAIDGWAAERGFDPPGGLLTVASEAPTHAEPAAR